MSLSIFLPRKDITKTASISKNRLRYHVINKLYLDALFEIIFSSNRLILRGRIEKLSFDSFCNEDSELFLKERCLS